MIRAVKPPDRGLDSFLIGGTQMKLSKWKKLAALLCTLTLVFGLSACTTADTEKEPASDGQTDAATQTPSENTAEAANGSAYVFEAEYTYMNDVVGGGISGAAAGLNMIVESADASNGFYIGSTHSTKCVLTFRISSDADTTATLRVLLGSELGTMKLNPENFIVCVNGSPVNYKEITVPAEAKVTGKTFTQFKIGDISLKAGENTITFQVGPNEYCNGGPGGPLFDAIKLTASANLTMEEYPENVE